MSLHIYRWRVFKVRGRGQGMGSMCVRARSAICTPCMVVGGFLEYTMIQNHPLNTLLHHKEFH